MSQVIIPMIDIKSFISKYDPIAQGFEQFAVDWIEETLERIEEILESSEITTDDETYCGALHYRVDNIIEIMKTDAKALVFLVQLKRYLEGK